MSQVQTSTSKAQENAKPARQPEQKPGRQAGRGPLRALAAPNRLTPADILTMQRTVGNRQVRDLLAPHLESAHRQTNSLVQRQEHPPDRASNVNDPHAERQQTPAERDQLVATQIEQFLEQFSNIQVTVRWQENGESRSESVPVHPPYFINRENAAQRLGNALAQRSAARGAMSTLLRQIRERAPEVPPQPGEAEQQAQTPPSAEGPRRRGGRPPRAPARPRAIQPGDVRGRGRALVGKATPEDIQTIVQEALDQDLVPAGAGRTHPNAADLRAWLVRYGIGVDCSGFVSQALNQVMAEVPGGPGAEQLNITGTNARALTGRRGRGALITTVARPADLVPGDTMGLPGHIRIVIRVETTAEGVQITTAESSSAADIGPTRAVWLYPDPTRFRGLLRRYEGPPPPPRPPRRRRGQPVPPPAEAQPAGPPPAFHWRPSRERVTWGRYRRLAALRPGQPEIQRTPLDAATAVINQDAKNGRTARSTLPSVYARTQPAIQRDWSDAPAGGAATSQPGVTAPASPQGWNRREFRVGDIRRIPLEGLAAGNQAATANPAASESAAGRAIVLIPAALAETPATVDVLLHLHGHNVGYRQRQTQGRTAGLEPGTVRDVEVDRIEQQLQAHVQSTGRMMIGVLPQGTTRSGFGASGFDSEAYLTEIFGRIWPGHSPPARGRIVLSAHSGGGGEIAQMLAGRRQSRLPAQMTGAGSSGVLALFDAINGPNELSTVQAWVRSQLNHDFAQLQALPSEAAQLAYLAGSMRFRSYYSPGSGYETRNRALFTETIEAWFMARTHRQVLRGDWNRSQHRPDGASSAVYQALFANYQVIRAGGADHEHIVGAGDRLQQALGATPSARQPAQSQGTSQPPVQPARIVQRQSVQQRSGPHVGAVTGPPHNQRGDVLHTMDRLHRLWSLSNPDYDAEYPRVSGLAAGSTVPQALIPLTIAAIRRNEEPTLHREVARHFLNLDLSANVGRGQTNTKTDVSRLQTALHALGRLPDASFASEQAAVSTLPGASVTNADTTIPATLAALTDLKKALAGGRMGWAPIHADEGEDAGDRFGGRTLEFGIFSIFVPRGAPADRNKVHVFFSPGGVQGESGLNAVLTHGLRGASDASEWILIAVPGAEPGHHVITNADIAACLARSGRQGSVVSLRLSAHSRGYRGLRETVRGGLIPTALVDRVVILDANYASIASVLERSGISASKVVAYGVTTGNLALRGARNIRLPADGMRAIGYSRLIQDAMVTRPDLSIPAAIRSQLLPLPERGRFTTQTPPPPGKVNIVEYCRVHQTEISAIVRQENDPVRGLKHFIDTNDLVRFGMAFSAGIYSHHFFVAEIAHEITD